MAPPLPPFNQDISGLNGADLDNAVETDLPASFRDNDNFLHRPRTVLIDFLRKEFDVKPLNKIHKHLRVAGLPMPPRPLNILRALSREIVPDERIDMHLVWENSLRMHVKPLPRYILNQKFWESCLRCGTHCYSPEHKHAQNSLDSCKNELCRCILGFLFSYMALVQYESDFAIAQDFRLLPKDLTWETWVGFVRELLNNEVANTKNVNERYYYGELRLSRLRKIYFVHGCWDLMLGFFRVCGYLFLGYENPYQILRGYEHPYQTYYQTYHELLHAYLTPISVSVVYVGLVLTAMQVGLATNRLKDNLPFQRASYGFTVFSIIAPLILLVLFGVISLYKFFYHCVKTDKFQKHMRKVRE